MYYSTIHPLFFLHRFETITEFRHVNKVKSWRKMNKLSKTLTHAETPTPRSLPAYRHSFLWGSGSHTHLDIVSWQLSRKKQSTGWGKDKRENTQKATQKTNKEIKDE